MTSRIQEDSGGTEAKWADIEEDEDDWAPEAIEWTDGTKSTLTNNEPPPPPPQENETSKEEDEIPKEQPREENEPKDIPPVEQEEHPEEKKIIPKQTTTIGPNPTILRLGAGAERQARNANVSSKLPGEKPSPASTSPAPVPAKSPWAPLPPVDKVSPVVPPVQTQRSPRPSIKEPREPREPISNENAPGPNPLKEIAADDFSRSWREDSVSAPRELYNSRSGRYEPVSETRKGSMRTEQGFRATPLLQRQMHHETTGPAEHLSIFQAHRPGMQDGAQFTHRRTSSSVSGGSGGFRRRLSNGRSDLPQHVVESRRGTHANGIADPALHPVDFSRSKEPSSISSPAWQMRSPSAVEHVEGTGPPGGLGPNTKEAAAVEPVMAPKTSAEDPVVMQGRIMKEKRLEARQRRLEQEEKEEAEKRERIRQKLEALGPPLERPRRKSLEASKPEVSSIPNTVHQPPKPPVPEPTGEPKQYGMMKVHHPDNVKKLVAANEKEKAAERSLLEKSPSEKPHLERPHLERPPHERPHIERPHLERPHIEKPPLERPTLEGPLLEKLSPAKDIRHTLSPPPEPIPDLSTAGGARKPNEPHVQVSEKLPEPRVGEDSHSWKGNLGIAGYSPWTSSAKFGPVSSPIMNPWKPLSNDRTLGNGIFDQPLGGFPPRDLPLRGLGLDQPPIGPSIVPNDRILGPQPFPAAPRPPQETPTTLPSPEIKHVNPIARPAPIGPPSSQPPPWPQQDPRRIATAAWNNFHSVAHRREAEENEQLLREVNTVREEPRSLNIPFEETWRQLRTGDHLGQRQTIGISRTVNNNVPVPSILPGFDLPIPSLPFSDSHPRPLTGGSRHGSRFFPPAPEPPKEQPIGEREYRGSFSPPPPEESDHPVFSSHSQRPLVHLPAPKPVVKLPPKVAAPPPPVPTFASMAAAPPPPRVVAQPVSAATIWQEKINGLFGKKSGEKKNALAVAPASKEPLDVQVHTSGVSVSLPQDGKKDNKPGNEEAASRQVEEEEDLFEDREAGSLPVVRVPDMAPPAAWVAAQPPPDSRVRSKNLKSTQVQSVEPFFSGYGKDQHGNIQIPIRLPGSNSTKVVLLPKKGGNSGRQRHSTYKPRKQARSREGSRNFKKSSFTRKDSSPHPQPVSW